MTRIIAGDDLATAGRYAAVMTASRTDSESGMRRAIAVEAKLTLELGSTVILPAAIRYQTELALAQQIASALASTTAMFADTRESIMMSVLDNQGKVIKSILLGKKHTRGGGGGDDDSDPSSLTETLGSEDDALEGVEYRESLKPLLAALSERERQIIMMRFFQNMTQAQIAEEVGVSQMHVSRLLTKALLELRSGLTEDAF